MAIIWIALIVVTFIDCFIHFMWYYPKVFGNAWLRLVGKEGEPKSKIIRDTIIMIPTSFVTILILALMMDLTGITDIISAILLALLVWVGFVATVGINQNNFNDRGVKLFLLEYGFYLVGFIIAGIILAIWR